MTVKYEVKHQLYSPFSKIQSARIC